MDKLHTFMKEMQAKGYDLSIPDETKNTVRISTGVTSLDYVTDGGLAPGHRLELWGENQGGKSLLTLKIIAEFQKLNKICILMDSEGSFDSGWAIANGVEPEKLLLSEPETLEDAGDMMVDMMLKGADLIVVDSIANLINEAELERDTNQPTRGGNAKVNTLITRKLSAHAPKHPTVFVFVNQIRINMGKTYGDNRDTGGGKALKHFYDTRVLVSSGQTIKEADEIIGKQIVLNCNKNKKGVPRRVHNFDFYHDGTINNKASLLNLAVKYGIVERGGAWYSYEDIKGQGEQKFGEAISEANKWDEIEQKVWKHINPKLKSRELPQEPEQPLEDPEAPVKKKEKPKKKRGRKPKDKTNE